MGERADSTERGRPTVAQGQTLEEEVPSYIDEADWSASPVRETCRIARRVATGDANVSDFAGRNMGEAQDYRATHFSDV